LLVVIICCCTFIKTKTDETSCHVSLNVMPDARQCGIFRFRFYHLGEWIDILIDDILPTKNAAIAVKNEYWMLLLEKAYAKFLGSYDALAGGDPCWALCNLTGGIV